MLKRAVTSYAFHVPHAIFGFVLGIIPVLAVTSFSTFLLKGQSFQSAFQENFIALDTFKSFRRHYMHSMVDPIRFFNFRENVY